MKSFSLLSIIDLFLFLPVDLFSALAGPKEFTSVFYSLQEWRVS